MARARPPHVRSVQTPEALAALRAWLKQLPTLARERGEDIFAQGVVERVWAGADHYVEAKVTGEEPCSVTLFLTLGKWNARCTCERRTDCLHTYAAARAWLGAVESGTHTSAPPLDDSPPTPTIAIAPAAPDLPAPPTKVAFREHWSPRLAKKIGRPLTEAEDNQLENLAALFSDFVQAHGTIYPGTLLRHGFEYAPVPGAPLHSPAYSGWWDPAVVPADPWALWQFIAHEYASDGREIPEAFRPQTDLATTRAAVEARALQNDISTWQRALAVSDDASSAPRSHPATSDLAGLRARVRPEGGISIEVRSRSGVGTGKAWRPPPQKWFVALATARPIDFDHLTPPEAALGVALAAECAAGLQAPSLRQPLPAEAASNILRTRAARDALVLADGQPFVIQEFPLALQAGISTDVAERLDLHLVTPDGRDASRATLVSLRPSPLYYFEDRVWNGPPPIPTAPLPTAALSDMKLMSRLRAVGLRLPAALERDVRRVILRPVIKCWLTSMPDDADTMEFHAVLVARADEAPVEQQYLEAGWQWTARGAPAPRRPGEPLLEFDLTLAQTASARLLDFRVVWREWQSEWTRGVSPDFPDEFIAWHASLPSGIKVEASPGLANLLGPPLMGHVEFTAAPAETLGRDWFNVSVKLRIADTTLNADEIALLAKARGKWVALPRHGWRRLEIENESPAALDRLGLDTGDVLTDGRTHTHRVHALQLASEADALELKDARLAAALRERARTLATQPAPPLPAGLRATLRPYQQEGYHFLAHLAALSLGGVLADDMGLGKTVQTLAWLLHLAETHPASAPTFRVLVVCPKSVTHGWLTETERFAPSLHARSFDPMRLGPNALFTKPESHLLVANYTQLRINATWFKAQAWDAVVLDEGQFIKNPASQVATTARALVAKHRVVLTGTPIENRLSDLWSLFAFAQPGLLGTQSAFRRQYHDTNPAAHERLHRRVRHFLLRRTKAQAAPELPSRTEDDLIVELEGAQRTLYDAELKRARAHLLGINNATALAAVRFNVLSSLLRLRQICCHPALIDPAHRDLPSAKLEALLERLEELQDEGHQVLVFSQFVEMLEIIRHRLVAENIGHLMLTGQTENRAELVDEFQRDKSKTVFLLSLKAAGFGLNLTAASYVILYDPWWNPAAEAQAIDRTHRIGQTQPVVAYRLLAESTVEEKIRSLQREKAALAAAVVQEESLSSILDLDSLKQILA
ncbi:MAG: DEAD/DEAH box helicase [Verrucomicrobiota bacterium]